MHAYEIDDARASRAQNDPGSRPVQAGRYLLAHLDGLSDAQYLVSTPGLRIAWMNAEGERTLRAGRGLSRGGDRLLLHDGDRQGDFQDFARRAIQTSAAWVLSGFEGAPPMSIRGVAVRPSGCRQMLMLTVRFVSDEDQIELPDLANVFRLTPAEGRVLDHLTNGRRAEALAERLNISIETARTHIRRIYTKMNVASREEVICLANRFRAV